MQGVYPRLSSRGRVPVDFGRQVLEIKGGVVRGGHPRHRIKDLVLDDRDHCNFVQLTGLEVVSKSRPDFVHTSRLPANDLRDA
jgi:hypothetical protein